MSKGVQELARRQLGAEPWAMKYGLMEKEGKKQGKEGHAGSG